MFLFDEGVATMAVVSCYVDVPGFVAGAMGVETASLLGGNSTVASAAAQGATSLVVASGVGFAAGPGWVLDGPNSEAISITAVAGATLTLAVGLQAAHAAGVCVATGGAAGSLADVLVRASAWVEGYCGQGRPGNASDPMLFALSRSERYRLPGPHAVLDPAGVLTVRPLHFPVQSVSALTLDWGQGQTWTLDASQIEFPETARGFDMPPPLPVLGTTGFVGPLGGLPRAWSDIALSRAGPIWVACTYTGGLTAGALPYDFVQGVGWVACHFLGYRENPTGAAERRLGKKALVSRLRGDIGDESLLLADAKRALAAYRNQPF
jgi:hypothetical protein